MAFKRYVILPWGGDNKHKIRIRMEAFNAFNQTSFATPSLSLGSSATFGEFSATANSPRVMQFALRYEFGYFAE
jgi:hypothetical protein